MHNFQSSKFFIYISYGGWGTWCSHYFRFRGDLEQLDFYLNTWIQKVLLITMISLFFTTAESVWSTSATMVVLKSLDNSDFGETLIPLSSFERISSTVPKDISWQGHWKCYKVIKSYIFLKQFQLYLNIKDMKLMGVVDQTLWPFSKNSNCWNLNAEILSKSKLWISITSFLSLAL